MGWLFCKKQPLSTLLNFEFSLNISQNYFSKNGLVFRNNAVNYICG